MSVDIIVPALGESVASATVARWMKQPGDAVAADEALVELETDKVSVEINAPAGGVMGAILAAEGAEVEVGNVLATIEESRGRATGNLPAAPAAVAAPVKNADRVVVVTGFPRSAVLVEKSSTSSRRARRIVR